MTTLSFLMSICDFIVDEFKFNSCSGWEKRHQRGLGVGRWGHGSDWAELVGRAPAAGSDVFQSIRATLSALQVSFQLHSTETSECFSKWWAPLWHQDCTVIALIEEKKMHDRSPLPSSARQYFCLFIEVKWRWTKQSRGLIRALWRSSSRTFQIILKPPCYPTKDMGESTGAQIKFQDELDA